ncbi:MAG TPA: SUF system NifU family Fe-S cluster assembly protein [Burkholderiales bacterium]|nr:SUF system NifU family Fe-S cluster assembly protein [Burkholderiales bacterium]
MTELRNLYDDVIMDHIRNARNFRKLEGANREAEGSNPLCGDVITIYLRLQGEVIEDIGFQCSCCGISMASASIMTESVKGKNTIEARSVLRQFSRLLAQSQSNSSSASDDLYVLAAVREYPSRVNCATLAWETLERALDLA